MEKLSREELIITDKMNGILKKKKVWTAALMNALLLVLSNAQDKFSLTTNLVY